MSKQRNLVIKKRPAYVWRVHSLGMGENFNYIPCWYVVDADTDQVVWGSYRSGNNCQSGSAEISRKKDAKAFIDGYNSRFEEGEKENPYVLQRTGKGLFGWSRPKGSDDKMQEWWECGYEWDESKRILKKKFSDINK